MNVDTNREVEQMSTRISEHIRSNVVGYIAIFMFAIGGSAYGLAGSNTVFTDDITNGEVKGADIGSGQVGNADLATNAVNSGKVTDNSLTGADVDEATLNGSALNNVWKVSGNTGTTGALGTNDNNPLNLEVNNARALRLEPTTIAAPNVIGGMSANTVTAGVNSATISGGGSFGGANLVTDDGGTVGGGDNNRAGNNSGGLADREFATVGGGVDNIAGGSSATVAGGQSNDAAASQAFVGGGNNNTASGSRATVGGGDNNASGATAAAVAGGQANTASGTQAFVGGGSSNTASGLRATVAGGVSNSASGASATVAGGQTNDASGSSATVAGGNNNAASGVASTVTGGELNLAKGDYSLAAGRRAQNTADHAGVFLFADSSNVDFSSTAANQFAVRSTGGARFVTAINGTTGAPTAGVTLASGGGSWSSLSDRASKTAVAPVSGREVLDKLSEVPVSTWGYRAQDPSIRHIGPMAQDFARAFGVGEDARHITSIDADGVALAAIKGLNERFEALGGGTAAPGAGAEASGLVISPVAVAGIALLAAMLASVLTAAFAPRWRGAGGRLVSS